MGRRRIVRHNGSSSQEVRPLMHFCKTICPDILEDKKLRLPNAFINAFEGELSDVVKVVDPKGRIWKIGLKKSDNHVWFDHGWHEFVEHYSISSGYILVFGYSGSSNFSVLICNLTTCEIQYPYNGPERVERSINGEKHSTDTGDEVLDEDYVEIIGSSSPHALPRKILKGKTVSVKSTKRDTVEEQNQEMNEHIYETRSKKRVMEEPVEVGTYDACSLKQEKFDEQGIFWTPFVFNEMKDGENELLGDADAIRSGMPKHEEGGDMIHSSMPKHEGAGDMINDSIPKQEGAGDMINDSIPKQEGAGEMINSSIFTSGLRKASRKSERAIHNARKFKTRRPSFMVVLRPHHLYNSIVHLPAEFSKMYMSNVPEYIKLQVSDGREWVSRIYRTNRTLTIGSGWRFFFKENNLDEGDVLVFEWVKKDITMKISIFRAVQENEMVD